MKRILLTTMIVALAGTGMARAQFGSGIVFDPTQSAHALQQIWQAEQLYTTTIQTTQNVIAAYNLAERMASAPQMLYSGYSNMGRQMWTSVTTPANTYGNTQMWIEAATTGTGAMAGNQQVSVPTTSRISGYSSLSPQGQQQLAAQGATADLSDAANATTLQTLGTIRANAAQRESDISNLEQASHSTDTTQQTELATLQRINQALLIQLRTQQESNQIAQAQSLQQLVGQKQKQDEMKELFQAANGYEANYTSKAGSETNQTVSKALHY
jgi:hypothetical protein